MHVVIPNRLVAEQEIAVPCSGAVLRGLALRLHDFAGAIEAPKVQQTIRGRVSWLRRDDANELWDMAIDTGQWAVMARESFLSRRGARLGVGRRVDLAGRLEGIDSLEFDRSDLPDVRADWLVESATQNEETLEWHVDLGPAA
jgi:hypothetical protein